METPFQPQYGLYKGFKRAYPLLYVRFVMGKLNSTFEVKIKKNQITDFNEMEAAA